MPYKDELKRIQHSREYYLKNRDKIMLASKIRKLEKHDEIKKTNKKRYISKRDILLTQMKEYRKSNKDKVNESIAKWVSVPENKEKVRTYKKQWYKEWLKNHKGEKNAQTAKRYARKLKGTTKDADLKKIEEYFILAEKLTKDTGIKYSVDHIKPLILGGLHHQDNLQVITLADNIKKGIKYPYEVANRFFPSDDYVMKT